MMYSDVVMEKAAGVEPEHDKAKETLEKIMAAMKKEKGVINDADLSSRP